MTEEQRDKVNAAWIQFLESLPDGIHAQMLKAGPPLTVDGDLDIGTFLILSDSAKGLHDTRMVINVGFQEIESRQRKARRDQLTALITGENGECNCAMM
jgi:hypothetical protein